MYKTKLGIDFIDWFAKKFEKVLKPVQYIVLLSGYSLMIAIVWLFAKSTYIYLTTSISQVIKTPPIVPLIPYFPKLFGLESLLPPLYFTYFIIALAVVAISHEFSHGIFARLYKLKIHSTGFAFLGPILGAFVEPDEKQMTKAKKLPQMVVLAAGTFANVIMTLLFFGIFALFFTAAFMPAGVKFSTYSLAELNVSELSIVGNSSIGEGLMEVTSEGETYFVNAEALQGSIEKDVPTIFAYENAPAFRAQLRGAITEIDSVKIMSTEELSNVLGALNPGDEIKVKTALLNPGQGSVAETREYDLTLEEKDGRAVMGIMFIPSGGGGFAGYIFDVFGKIKDPFTHYESDLGNFGWFIYYLLWWIIAINFLVALFNMLPLGILDGGRFFYLTVWGLTKRESIGRKAYKIVMWFILLLLAAMMLKWVSIFF
ncbi:MAG: site-2 protease family protein [Nanoarchaeota archaeon]